MYSFELFTHRNTFDIKLNDSPINGSCSIDPSNGTMMTLFRVQCSNWTDQDPIRDYSIYGFTPNSSKTMMLAYSTEPTIYLRLPTNVNLIVKIRDTFGCVAHYSLPKVIVTKEDALKKSILGLLFGQDPKLIGQLILSTSYLFNEIHRQSRTSLSITPLHSENLDQMTDVTNASTIVNTNEHAEIREELVKIMNNFS
ncbi:unnamed protein product, partial [Adineta ricciae]